MPKTKHGTIEFPVLFYRALRYLLLFSGVFLIFSGYFLSESFFLKFTINNKLTDEALTKIANFKISLAVSGFIVAALALLMNFYKNNMINFISRKKAAFQKITLLFLTVFVLIMIIELAIRVILPKDIKRDFPPGIEEFREKYVLLNKEGYRDIEHSYHKGANTVRIAVLGDSFAYGSGIKNVNDTYAKKLEKMLNNKSKKANYEVLNFGKPGIDTEFEIGILKNDALRYKPDIIIVGYVLNDFRDFEAQKKGTNPYLFWLDIFLKRYSYLYNFVNKGFNIALEATGIKKSYYQTIIDEFSYESNKKLNGNYFKELKNIARDNNATLIIVVFPFIYRLNDYPFADANNIIKDIGKEYNIEVLDLLPYLRNFDEKKLVVSKYNSHPDELGHEIAANSIYEKLIKLKLAP